MTTKKAAKPKAKAATKKPSKKAPKKAAPPKSVEQKIASGAVDADHLVKWGDLRDHVK
jgi:hypothetical protein